MPGTADPEGPHVSDSHALVSTPTPSVGRPFFGLIISLTATNISAAPATAAGNTALGLNGSSQYATLGTASDLRSATFTLELWFQRTGAGAGTSTGTGGITAIPLITKGRAEAETAAADVNYFFGIDAAAASSSPTSRRPRAAQPSLNHPVTGTTAITQQRLAPCCRDLRRLDLEPLPRRRPRRHARGRPAGQCLTNALTSVGSARTTTVHAAGFFAGVIDEVRIWDNARSLAQIHATKDTEITTGQAGLLGAWNLNEGTGTSLADVSGNTITGAAVAPRPRLGRGLRPAPHRQHGPPAQRHAPVRDAGHRERPAQRHVHP